MKHLSDLITNLPDLIRVTGDATIIAPVEEDNRLIQPGGVFVARRGLSLDGHDFISDAIKRGAAAIVGEHDSADLNVPYVQVANAQEATGWLAAAYHDYPSRKLIVIGDSATLSALPFYRDFIKYSEEIGAYKTAWELPTSDDGPGHRPAP